MSEGIFDLLRWFYSGFFCYIGWKNGLLHVYALKIPSDINFFIGLTNEFGMLRVLDINIMEINLNKWNLKAYSGLFTKECVDGYC